MAHVDSLSKRSRRAGQVLDHQVVHSIKGNAETASDDVRLNAEPSQSVDQTLPPISRVVSTNLT